MDEQPPPAQPAGPAGPAGPGQVDAETEDKQSFLTKVRSVVQKPTPEDGQEEEKEKVPPVSLLSLYRYSERSEIIYIFIAILGAMAHGTTMPMFVIVFGSIINSFGNVVTPADQEKLVNDIGGLAKWFLILGGVAFVTATIQVRFSLISAHRISNRLRRLYFKSLMSQDMTWYDKVERGELTARISSDVNLVEGGIGDKVASAVQFLTTFFTGFIISFIYSWKLTLVVLASAPFLVIGGALFAKVAAAGAAATLDAYAAAGAIATEVLSLVRTVTAFNGQEAESKRYEGKLQAAYIAFVRNALFKGMAVGFTYFVIFATFAIAFVYGGLLVRNGEIEGGDVVISFFGVFIATMSLGQGMFSSSPLMILLIFCSPLLSSA